MDRVRVDKWLCFEVRTAATFSAVLGLINSSLLITLPPFCAWLNHESILLFLHLFGLGISENIFYLYLAVTILVVYGLVNLLLHLVLLIGVKRKQPSWMLPFIVFSFLGNTLAYIGLLIFPHSLPITAFNVYTLIAVWSHYQNIKEAQQCAVNTFNLERK